MLARRMRGLYPIFDLDALEARGIPVLEFAACVLAVRPALVQLRAKHASAKETVRWLRALGPPCQARGVALFANDRPDLAVIAGCAGVHLGQQDLPLEVARRLAPGLRIGVSTHDLFQLERALAERPDYVAFGPVYATTSKANPDPTVGLSGLRTAARLCAEAGTPLVAIGGLDASRAVEVGKLGAMGAVIGALLPRGVALDDVTEQARLIHTALGG